MTFDPYNTWSLWHIWSLWQNHIPKKFWRNYEIFHRISNPYSFSLWNLEENYKHLFGFKFTVQKLFKMLNRISLLKFFCLCRHEGSKFWWKFKNHSAVMELNINSEECWLLVLFCNDPFMPNPCHLWEDIGPQ